jgi:hypothetical protein
MTRRLPALAVCLALAACAATTGIVPIGPGTFQVSEMRAPVLGGGPEAQRAAIAEAIGFCARQGLQFAPLSLVPGGVPYSAYGPTNFTTAFRCVAPRQ